MNYVLLLLGFVLLIKGADIFVDGASIIAKKLGIPSVIVGLTIVSLGTSAPELAVSLISGINGNNEIAIGNVIGSNIFNILIVLGATAVISPLIIKKSNIKSDFIINTLVTIFLFIVTFDSLLSIKNNYISRLDGLILVFICLSYIIFLIIKTKNNHGSEEVSAEISEEIINANIFIKIITMIIGVSGIIIGGNLVVSSATNIAYLLGMSEKLVGLTIVAIGTSLPELVTSIVAAIKGENDIAIGNVLGSNIFNIVLILGLSSLINPIPVNASLFIDFIVLILINLFIGILIFINKNRDKKLSRIEGIILVCLYVAYMLFIIKRN
ncbi:calcium/sodium antiporter [Clostridium weizhouense]|uniref:Calcium/sodium antiporter n=1 Tax=Clostridium weizhouense TaxID=2859781 RepID=A0ABS7AMK8_9CLOT|nr:calcium/sodium antiporter [Clostridium weizhouense]MBW6409896.1 calcium/sodium antiporter [Clostridium weizhouense]